VFDQEEFSKDRVGNIESVLANPELFRKITDQIPVNSNILLVPDSNHIHEYVLGELQLLSPLLQCRNNVYVSDSKVEIIPTRTPRTASLAKWN